MKKRGRAATDRNEQRARRAFKEQAERELEAEGVIATLNDDYRQAVNDRAQALAVRAAYRAAS